jgi:hypothetical protein
MESGIAQARIGEADGALECALTRAQVAAHLITGNAERAEHITLAALEQWDSDWDSLESLIRRAVRLSARASMGFEDSWEPESAHAHLPARLRAVLRLPSDQRRCYALRVLAGMTRVAAAQLLSLAPEEGDRLTEAAMMRLASFMESAPFAEPHSAFEIVWIGRLDWAD